MSIPNPRTDLMTLAVIDKSHGWNWMMFLQVKLDNQVIIPTRFEHVHEVMKIIFRCYNNQTNNQHLAIISQESLCTWCTTKTAENEDDHRSSSKTMRMEVSQRAERLVCWHWQCRLLRLICRPTSDPIWLYCHAVGISHIVM